MKSLTHDKNTHLIKNGIQIGEGTRIWGTIDLHTRDVIIGKYAIVAGNVFVATHCPSNSMRPGGLKIRIGDYAYIGYGSIILPGVTIGNRSLVGAGSVVTKNIPDKTIAAGNPAKIIKNRSNEELLRTSLLTMQNLSTTYQDPDYSNITIELVEDILGAVTEEEKKIAAELYSGHKNG